MDQTLFFLIYLFTFPFKIESKRGEMINLKKKKKKLQPIAHSAVK